jgi:hypothetical protein
MHHCGDRDLGASVAAQMDKVCDRLPVSVVRTAFGRTDSLKPDGRTTLFVIAVVQVLEFFIPEFIELIVIVRRRRLFLPHDDSHNVISEFDNLLFGAHGTYLSHGAKRYCARFE